jgi:hypothetical protein
MRIFQSDGSPGPSAHARALSVCLGIHATHLMPPIVVIALVAPVIAVIITIVLTSVFWNPDLPRE